MGKTVKRTIVFMMVVLLGSVPSSKSIQITSRAKKSSGRPVKIHGYSPPRDKSLGNEDYYAKRVVGIGELFC